MRLAKILIDKGLVNREQMDRALEYKDSKRIRLDRALIQIGAVSEKDLLTALGEHLNMPLVNLVQAPVDPEVVKLLPPKLVYRRRVMPLWHREGLLEVAISNPFESYALDDIQLLTDASFGKHSVALPILRFYDRLNRLYCWRTFFYFCNWCTYWLRSFPIWQISVSSFQLFNGQQKRPEY